MYVNNAAGILRSPCQGKSLEDLRGLSPKLVRSTEGIWTSLEDADVKDLGHSPKSKQVELLCVEI